MPIIWKLLIRNVYSAVLTHVNVWQHHCGTGKLQVRMPPCEWGCPARTTLQITIFSEGCSCRSRHTVRVQQVIYSQLAPTHPRYLFRFVCFLGNFLFELASFGDNQFCIWSICTGRGVQQEGRLLQEQVAVGCTRADCSAPLLDVSRLHACTLRPQLRR